MLKSFLNVQTKYLLYNTKFLIHRRFIINENHATRKFTKTHEWIDIKNRPYPIGLSSYAQDNIGDLTFVSLPTIGDKFSKGEKFCVLESSKAATDVFMPISGEIVAVNSKLSNNPTLINKDPYDEGWIVKVADIDENDPISSCFSYMDYSAYKNYIEKENDD